MAQELNDDEKDFLDNILSQRKDLQSEENRDSNIIAKKVNKKELKKKKKRDKVPGYKNPAHWIGAFLLLPVILSSVFFIGILRIESFFGKETLNWLAEQKVDDNMRAIAEQAGMGWLPDFLVFYEYRWIIIMILFTVCFAIAIIIMVSDAKRHKNGKENDEQNIDEINDDNSSIEENDELSDEHESIYEKNTDNKTDGDEQ